MTLQRVKKGGLDKNEFSLNGVRYPMIGQVQANLASIYPSKVVIGDTTRDSQQRLSVLSKSDWRGGIGVEVMESVAEIDRSWWTTAQIRYLRHLTLPPLATITAASGVTGVFTIGAINELADEIYVAFGTSVRKYDNVADDFGSSLHTLPNAATDSLTLRLDGTVYLIFAHTTGYTYTTDGSSFTDDTENVLYMAPWDNRLWGIDNTGQLRYSSTIGTWRNDAQLPLPDSSVTDLFAGRDAFGNSILYAMTTVGLYSHDAENATFHETEFGLPRHPDNGVAVQRFRGASYIPAGLSVYKYQDGSNPAVVTLVGPDRDDGVPADRRGVIRAATASHNELIFATDATSATAGTISTFHTTGFAGHGGGAMFSTNVVSAAVGFSYILGWDERGWTVKWLSTDSDAPIKAIHVSNSYDLYRLWWGISQRVYFMSLPRDILNPRQISDFRYADSARHEEPWFDAGQAEVDKLMVRVKVETRGCSATETVRPYFGVNYSDTWTALDAISTDGVTTYEMPNTSPTGTEADVGTEFRSFRSRVDLARGSADNTKAPAVVSITYEYRKKLTVRHSYGVQVDLRKPYSMNSPAAMRRELVTAIASNPLVEFTYRDDDGDTRNLYVDVTGDTSLENTGHDETGTTRLLMWQA